MPINKGKSGEAGHKVLVKITPVGFDEAFNKIINGMNRVNASMARIDKSVNTQVGNLDKMIKKLETLQTKTEKFTKDTTKAVNDLNRLKVDVERQTGKKLGDAIAQAVKNGTTGTRVIPARGRATVSSRSQSGVEFGGHDTEDLRSVFRRLRAFSYRGIADMALSISKYTEDLEKQRMERLRSTTRVGAVNVHEAPDPTGGPLGKLVDKGFLGTISKLTLIGAMFGIATAGLDKMLQFLSGISPHLQAIFKILNIMATLVFLPFGRFIFDIFKPILLALLKWVILPFAKFNFTKFLQDPFGLNKVVTDSKGNPVIDPKTGKPKKEDPDLINIMALLGTLGAAGAGLAGIYKGTGFPGAGALGNLISKIFPSAGAGTNTTPGSNIGGCMELCMKSAPTISEGVKEGTKDTNNILQGIKNNIPAIVGTGAAVGVAGTLLGTQSANAEEYIQDTKKIQDKEVDDKEKLQNENQRQLENIAEQNQSDIKSSNNKQLNSIAAAQKLFNDAWSAQWTNTVNTTSNINTKYVQDTQNLNNALITDTSNINNKLVTDYSNNFNVLTGQISSANYDAVHNLTNTNQAYNDALQATWNNSVKTTDAINTKFTYDYDNTSQNLNKGFADTTNNTILSLANMAAGMGKTVQDISTVLTGKPETLGDTLNTFLSGAGSALGSANSTLNDILGYSNKQTQGTLNTGNLGFLQSLLGGNVQYAAAMTMGSDGMENTMTETIGGMKQKLIDKPAAISGVFDDTKTGLTDKLKDKPKDIGAVFDNLTTQLGVKVGDIIGNVQILAQGIVRNVTTGQVASVGGGTISGTSGHIGSASSFTDSGGTTLVGSNGGYITSGGQIGSFNSSYNSMSSSASAGYSAFLSSFGSSAHMAKGGVIAEKILGIGMSTGKKYTIGEAGREYVVPESNIMGFVNDMMSDKKVGFTSVEKATIPSTTPKAEQKTFQITVPVTVYTQKDMDEKKLAEAISRAIKNESDRYARG